MVIAFPTTGRKENFDVQLKLIANAYAHAPNEIRSTMIVIMDSASKEYGVSTVIEKIEGCWDRQIANAINGIIVENTLKPAVFGYLLGKLLAHEDEQARELAESSIPLSPTPSDDESSRAVAAGKALMLNAKDGGWSVVWPAAQRNNDFGKALFEKVVSAGEHRQKIVAPDLTESELADFYIWLVRNYPHSEDPDALRGYGAYDVTPRHLLGRWRDSILSRLEHFGSYIACEEIRRIAREFPELDWLKWVLHSAQANTRRNTWEAPEPREILQMAIDSKSGLVQSGEQLLRAINESLKQLETKLQSGTAAAWELWDEKPICKPKREERLAQKVEAHLNETLTCRGIVANREVVVRRGRTDIHVDAVRKSPDGDVYDRVTVIIEVKGCWHRDLKTAMNTQLVARYLSENQCDYGLYLVGWFICDQWASESRKSRTPKWSLQEAQAFFDEQAKQCSRDGKLTKAFVLNAAL